MKVAALYVETDGVYYGLPDVDPWDEARDARLYAGPWPVVAHPPCKAWSIMGQCRPEIVRGDDGGCFAAALDAVRRFGGVLEHPAYSQAWAAFGLPRPSASGWTRSLLDDGWTCLVDQRRYGHPANKRTWLYVVGASLPAMRWGRGPNGVPVARDGGGSDRDKRSRTPALFRDALLEIARAALTPSPPSQIEGHPLRWPPMRQTLDRNAGESSSEPRRKRVVGLNPSQLDAEHAPASRGNSGVTQRPDAGNGEGRAAGHGVTGSTTDTVSGERLRSPSPASPRSVRD